MNVSLRLVLPALLAVACNRETTAKSDMARLRGQLTSKDPDRRLWAASDIARMCCSDDDERKGRPRDREAAESCVLLAELIATSRDHPTLDGALGRSPSSCLTPPPASAFLAALSSPWNDTRFQAVVGLWSFEPDDAIISALLGELERPEGDDTYPVHTYVSILLSEMGEADLERIAQHLVIGRPAPVRRAIAYALHAATDYPIVSPAVEAVLEAATNDPDPEVASYSRSALEKLRASAAAGREPAINRLVDMAGQGSGTGIRLLGRRRGACGSQVAREALDRLAAGADREVAADARQAIANRARYCPP